MYKARVAVQKLKVMGSSPTGPPNVVVVSTNQIGITTSK